MAIIISPKIRDKLTNKHAVTSEEIEQCFSNRWGGFLLDTREEHASVPPTKWFISETDYGRKLKIVFVLEDGDIYLRTAYTPNEQEMRIYASRFTK